MTEKKHNTGGDILSVLTSAQGQYISGEELSRQLGITRAAVWKRITALKNEGFEIEASTRKGYRLNTNNAPYGKASIQSHLRTKNIGRGLKYFTQIDSTNTALKHMALEDAHHGTVAVADCQSLGRGRLGRTWMSSPGLGIWMSVLLRPSLHPTEVQSLTLAAAVAVCRALKPLGIKDIGIKWPNDILINGKKVCGILTELSAEAERVTWVVLGIGINVNHLAADFETEISGTATSLRLENKSQNVLDRSLIAAEVLNSLEDVYESFIEKGSSWMVDEWKLWNKTLGKRVRLISAHGSENVTAIDILPDGRLIVKKEDGTVKEVISGEISLREIDH